MAGVEPVAGAWIVSPWPSTLLLLAVVLGAITVRKLPASAPWVLLFLGFALIAWLGPHTLIACIFLLVVGFAGVRTARSERSHRTAFVLLLLLPMVLGNIFEIFSIASLQVVGISYLTLELIGHLIDARTMPEDAARNSSRPLQFMMGHTLFAKIVAGPIPRTKDLIRHEAGTIQDHALRIAYGLLLKMVIADGAWSAFAEIDAGGGLIPSWTYGLAFTLRLYLDFSGYTHIAVGAAGLFGFKLPPNFNAPFLATSISDFWRRWHMSLSFWLRDYVFARLARRRWLAPQQQALLAAFVVMLLVGAWHGFLPGFLIWGALHGSAIVVERWWLGRKIPLLPSSIRRVVTWGFLVLTFLPFAFPADLKMRAARAALGFSGIGTMDWSVAPALLLLVVVVLVDHSATMLSAKRPDLLSRLRPELAVGAVALALVLFYALGFSGAEFIYAGF